MFDAACNTKTKKNIIKCMMCVSTADLCCRSAAEYRGEAGSGETGFPVAAGRRHVDRAGQGRGGDHHPCDPARHVL